MTRGMRVGLAALCVAALAVFVMFVVGQDNSPAANGIYSLAALVLIVAAPCGLITVAVSLLRGSPD